MASKATAMPRILLISIRGEPHESYFDERYGSLIEKIHAKAIVQRVKNRVDALNALSGEAPFAVLMTDAAVAKQQYIKVWDAVLKYVREGGTAVCMAQFSSWVKPKEVKPFFKRAGLPWEVGDYERTTVVLNRNAVNSQLAASLPPRYSQKASFLKNVEDADKWYRPNQDSVIESLVFAADPVSNTDKTPVAFAKVMAGRLGYVGDVNGEKDSEIVVLAMCGLHP